LISALFSDPKGNIFEDARLQLMGRLGRHLVRLGEKDLIELPEGSDFFFMPDDRMIGWDTKHKAPKITQKNPVAVFLPPGYTRTYLPASMRLPGAKTLPQWAYTACGFLGDRMGVAAIKTDESPYWDPMQIDPVDIKQRADTKRAQLPNNRIVNQIWTCAIKYGCMTARNYFLNRHEAAIPVSPACNASCVGCLSWQPADSCVSSHDRINFLPSVEEIVEIAIPHLEGGPKRIVSFGQGCEGEPLLQSELMGEIVRAIRRRTTRGTIHLNTNGSRPDAIEQLCAAGLDSIRVSLNSAQPEIYARYYRPRLYSFEHVTESIRVAHERGRFTSINYLSFPGLTDSSTEFAALCSLIESTGLQMIQWRNLNIDPDAYVECIGLSPAEPALGMRALLDSLRKQYRDVRHGYVNPPLHRAQLDKLVSPATQ